MTDRARSWVEQLLPTAATLDPHARAELQLAAVAATREADDAAARAARDRLGPVLETISEPYLHAIAELAMGWTSSILGDPDRAAREASASLGELRGQDEPFWTAVTLTVLGVQEMTLGRYDDASDHLREMSDLAERLGNDRLIAGARLHLGTLAVAQSRLDEAAALLEKALDLSWTRHWTRVVSLSLAAFAQWAGAEGDVEQAARLAGAAEGVRRRAGLRPFATPPPMADLFSHVGRELGPVRFDELFTAGTRLSQREAIAAVRAGAAPTRARSVEVNAVHTDPAGS